MVLTYGKNIRHARAACELSQAELARRVGTRRQQVYDWEKQRSQPSLEHLIKLADALGCSVDDLLRPPEPHSPG